MEISIIGGFEAQGRRYARAHPIAGRHFTAPSTAKDTPKTAGASSAIVDEEEWYHITPHKDPEHGDEELYIVGSTVFWMRSASLVMSVDMQAKFGTQTRVTHALFARFNRPANENNRSKSMTKKPFMNATDDVAGLRWQDVSPPPKPTHPMKPTPTTVRALIVVMPETLCIYFESGRDYLIHTPFQMEWVYPLDLGVLIAPSPIIGTEPTLYTLHHVEDDVRAVAVTTEDSMFTDERQLFVNRTERVVTTIETTTSHGSLVLTHDNTTYQVTLYSCQKLDLVKEEYYPVEGSADSESRRESIIYSRRSTLSRRTSMNPMRRESSIDLDALQERTDLRRTTMDIAPIKRKKTGEDSLIDAYEDEDDEEILSKLVLRSRKRIPTISLTKIWSGSFDKSKTVSEVFLAHDIQGREQLFICQPDTKMVSVLSLTELKIITSMPALSAQPILSTRVGQTDVLILQAERMVLWTGRQLIQCSLPINFQALLPETEGSSSSKRRRSSAVDMSYQTNNNSNYSNTSKASSSGSSSKDKRSTLRSPARASRVVGLADSAGYHVNMVLSNDQIFRTSLNFTPNAELVMDALTAMSFALPSTIFDTFRSRFLTYRFRPNRKRALDQQAQEWQDFVVVLFSFCHSKPHLTKQVPSPKVTSPWEAVLASSAHQQWSSDPIFKRAPPIIAIDDSKASSQMSQLYNASKELYLSHHTERSIIEHMSQVLNALHVVYEDLKLSVLELDSMCRMGSLLIQLASYLGADDYVDHYIRDGIPAQETCVFTVTSGKSPQLSQHQPKTPPSIYHWLMSRMKNKSEEFPVLKTGAGLLNLHHTPWHQKPCHRTESICHVYNALFTTPPSPPNTTSDEAMVSAMVEKSMSLAHLDILPFGIALPIREALKRCRAHPPGLWNAQALILVGREDVAEQICGVTVPSLHVQPPRPDAEPVKDVRTITETVTPFRRPEDDDGTKIGNHPVIQLLFSKDGRLEVAGSLLSSFKPVVISEDEFPLTQVDRAAAAQKFMSEDLSRNVCSRPVGRAIYAFATSQPQLQESYPIPPLRITAIFAHSANPETFEEVQPHQVTDWPLFHNGVAAALRISPQAEGIDGHWIVYNKSIYNLDSSHAGFLLGMGLTGHLRKLDATQAYNYMKAKHEASSIGLLLGLCASYAGTGESVAKRLVELHVPGLLPSQSSLTGLNFSSPVITTAILALGYLHSGTMTRQYAEIFLHEIGRTDISGDQPPAVAGGEGYALASGAALGLLALGKGNAAVGLSDMYILETLQRYVFGRGAGKPDSRRLYGVSMASAPPPVFDPSHTNMDVFDTVMTPPANTDMTAPGALIAMTFMYLKTNDISVVNRIILPSTHHMLDFVRPDHLVLRVLGRAMIMWDAVQPTREWIDSQIPDILLRPVTQQAMDIDKLINDGGSVEDEFMMGQAQDANTVRQAYFCTLTGACLSLGIRFAGSANQQAFELLQEKFDFFYTFLLKPVTGFTDKLDRAVCRACLDTVAVSMSLVMAGTGDARCLQQLKRLTSRYSTDTYGDHMATNMALGFLFMGGGTMTLGTTNSAIASLILSVYPRWPMSKDDNRCHLQAFRHLWVLAAEPRCIVPIDVDSKIPVYVPLTITIKDPAINHGNVTTISPIAPCLLPDFAHIQTITVDSPRYLKMTLNLADNPGHMASVKLRRTLVVKRKTGHLSYQEDPHGYRSILARPFPKMTSQPSDRDMLARQDVVTSLSSDPQLVAFLNTFCRVSQPQHPESVQFASFCTDVLYECLTQDKPEALTVYMNIFNTLNQLGSLVSSDRGLVRAMNEFWNLKLVVWYYQAIDKSRSDDRQDDGSANDDDGRMIKSSFMDQVTFHLSKHFDFDHRANTSAPAPTSSLILSQSTNLKQQNYKDATQIFDDYVRDGRVGRGLAWQTVLSYLVYADVMAPSDIKTLVSEVRGGAAGRNNTDLMSVLLPLLVKYPSCKYDVMRRIVQALQ
ncbi:hypothetical protein SmJEL517_g02637 [Synchytrium microbalum]|uniref:Uncharacterized protein n=1 Tax=Synchytrium microbalum TaxID=1806994 RepID=A0A507C011_9FUNG|nr:uncharacterized protein SmJEL517_g02637 [Synchytrium microbalum]TPX34860.1 hypothetical protein SmJEL517_g02637 [Synchytrium microbalum]